ncbi:hypothetical protein OHV13_03380 [Kitasatospora purpeofusca]|uniref:hypothetical protein n=1 Tax=Kitasatospora purpeofusca TaxID=67352 RepID=UPI0032489920
MARTRDLHRSRAVVRDDLRAVASVALLSFFSAAPDPGQPRASSDARGSIAPHTVRLTTEDRSAVARTGHTADNGMRALAHRTHARNLDRSPSVTGGSEGFAGWTEKNEPIEAVEVPARLYEPSGFLCPLLAATMLTPLAVLVRPAFAKPSG